MSLQVAVRRRRSPPDSRQPDFEQFWEPQPNEAGAIPMAETRGAGRAQSIRAPRPLCPYAGELEASSGTSGPGPRVDIGDSVPSTLADVLVRLGARPRARDYDEMACAVRGVGKVLGLGLGEIPARPESLGPLLAAANPARIGMRPQRWGRIRSLLRAALNDAGISVMPGRDISGLAPAWRALAATLPKRGRYGLSRILSFFSRENIEPERVDDAAFLAFQEALKGRSIEEKPDALFRDIVRLWNEAARTTKGWPPPTTVPTPDGRRAVLPAESFPASFRADVEACLFQAGELDPFATDYFRPLRPATVISRRNQLYFAARTLVASGFPIARITSLSVVVDVTHVETILRRLRQEKGDTPSLGALAQTLSSVAARWVKPAEADAERLRDFAKRLTVKKKGMTAKNRARLEQFDNPANVRALFDLPERVRRQVERKDDGTNGEAVNMAMALAVEILIVAPLRMANLTGLRIDKHIKIVRHGRHDIAHIKIAAEETKTSAPIDLTLPAETANLLAKFIKTYRPRIADGAGPFLFAGRGGARRAQTNFSSAISTFIRRETGLVINAHLFRHLAAKLHLEAHPEDIESVRQLLGHTTTKVTLNAYAAPDTKPAFDKWGTTVAAIRGGSIPTARHVSRGARKGDPA